MTKKKETENKRQIITERINCDTSRLYGDIDDAIKYLSEMRDQYQGKRAFGLDEHWTGYEDMEMVLSFEREENDEEYSYRLKQEEWDRQRVAEDAKRKEQREQDLKALKRLESKLGIWR